MKHMFLIFMAILPAIFCGCTALNRVNPTDPQATNYCGMHYLGSIGEFTKLEDFTVAGDKIWSVDSVTNRIYRFSINGYTDADRDFSYNDSFIAAPTGICSDNTFLYMVDRDMIISNIKRYAPEYLSNTPTQQFIASSLVFTKCAASLTYVFAATATDIYRYENTTNAPQTFTWAGFTSISDIKYNAATNELVVADSGTNSINVYGLDEPVIDSQIRHFDFTEKIIGFGIKDNFIYVPTATGIHQYLFDSGAAVKTFANYGEGLGRVTKAGPCGVYENYVYVGDRTEIKSFGP